jgi:hypothetical protein
MTISGIGRFSTPLRRYCRALSGFRPSFSSRFRFSVAVKIPF